MSAIKSKILVKLTEHMDSSKEIPKQLIISDKKLRNIRSQWIIDRNSYEFELSPGIYVVELFLSSKHRYSQVIELFDGEEENVIFDIASLSPHEVHEWAYFSKNISPRPVTDGEKIFTGLNTTLWTFESNQWNSTPGPLTGIELFADGMDFEFSSTQSLQLLEVNVNGADPLFVCLPSAERLKCLIKPRNFGHGQVGNELDHPLEVVVSTKKWVTESLLSLLMNGAMVEADDLAKNQHLAEELLYAKVQDPTSACVGGYYLLKMQDIEKMHNWPKNLCNWFAWLPDGAIIYAWQLLLEGRRENKIEREKIEELLLKGYNRGVPIYSEGLRLLHEGLRLLSFNKGKNNVQHGLVLEALDRVKSLCAICDWSTGTTTFSMPMFSHEGPFPVLNVEAPDDLDSLHKEHLKGILKGESMSKVDSSTKTKTAYTNAYD